MHAVPCAPSMKGCGCWNRIYTSTFTWKTTFCFRARSLWSIVDTRERCTAGHLAVNHVHENSSRNGDRDPASGANLMINRARRYRFLRPDETPERCIRRRAEDVVQPRRTSESIRCTNRYKPKHAANRIPEMMAPGTAASRWPARY